MNRLVERTSSSLRNVVSMQEEAERRLGRRTLDHPQRSNRCPSVASFLVLLMLLVGCGGNAPTGSETRAPTKRAAPQPIRLLVVDDPPLADAIRLRWAARAEGELSIENRTSDDLLTVKGSRLDSDVILYPAGLVGEFVRRQWIQPMDRSRLDATSFERGDIFELLRLRETNWGATCHAVPLGSPVFVIVYRADLFQTQRLTPPASWQDYQQLAKRLSKNQVSESAPQTEAPWRASLEPLAAGWAGQSLLARAAPYVRHRDFFSTLFDYQTMEPLIHREPFVRALEELVASHTATSHVEDADVATLTPQAVYREVAEGRCGMAITWVFAEQQASSPLGFAELPGSKRVYNFAQGEWETRRDGEPGRVPLLSIAGRLGSVTTSARQSQQAAAMLTLLASEDWSATISPRSLATTMFRKAHLADASRWSKLEDASAKQYGDVLSAALDRGAWMFSPRLPGRRQYLDALDEAVHRAVAKQATPQQALDEASKTWASITEGLGVDRQKAAFAASLSR